MAAKHYAHNSELGVGGDRKAPVPPATPISLLELPTLAYASSIQKAVLDSAAPGPSTANAHIQITYPPTPSPGRAYTDARNTVFRRRGYVHFAALCWFMFLEGWNDGTPGPLLPIIQQTYHVCDKHGLFLSVVLSSSGDDD